MTRTTQPHVQMVDERESSWEVDAPSFRVFLWRQAVAPPGSRQQDMGHSVSTYELTGVDVHEAIAWAEEHAGDDHTYTLFACHTDLNSRLGMIRLGGVEPTHGPDDTEYSSFRIRPDHA